MTLEERARGIRSRHDLAEFLEALLSDKEANSVAWENDDLASFLHAMAAWAQDMAGFYANYGERIDSVPPWRIFAEMLLAARTYE